MAIAGTSTAPAAAAPPNIVLILVDELGGPFNGQGVPTPNIAAIGSRGAVFTNAYASPACVPGCRCLHRR